ncbi:hypothetical protein FGIG_04044 [Fasciola gigantica]|uniref:Uncharacterized protein n=1 Tax=Fasciola gigantica TaxID=46835 RepID=A0A504Y9Z5_FASGI|nr:hypothetical protein FGIG_04044 [Fasciola gigantica]
MWGGTTLIVVPVPRTIGNGKVNTIGIGSTAPSGSMGHDTTTIVVTEAVSETISIGAGTTGAHVSVTRVDKPITWTAVPSNVTGSVNYKEITSTRFVEPSEILSKSSKTPCSIVTETRAQTATEEHGRSTNVTSKTSNMMKTNEPTTMLTSSETSAVNGTERCGRKHLICEFGCHNNWKWEGEYDRYRFDRAIRKYGARDTTTIVVTEAVSENISIARGTTGAHVSVTRVDKPSLGPQSRQT